MKENNGVLQIGISLMIGIITIVATYVIIDIKTKSISTDVIKKMLAIEYDKVGGIENYVKVTDYQRQYTISTLSQYDEGGGQQQQPSGSNNAPTPTVGTQTSVDVNAEGTYILGSPDAEISYVEYSDLECPYCKRLHSSGVIEQILEKYDGKVNFIFKHFPLTIHPQAGMEAEAALCVGSLSGADKYYEFINTVFSRSSTNGRSFTKESISVLGGSIGIDQSELLSCIESRKFSNLVQSQTKEGSGYGITGTPGNVIINNKTGRWKSLAGAHPYESFKVEIDNLLE